MTILNRATHMPRIGTHPRHSLEHGYDEMMDVDAGIVDELLEALKSCERVLRERGIEVYALADAQKAIARAEGKE